MRSAVQRRHTMRSAGAQCATELVTADTAYIMRILLLTLRLFIVANFHSRTRKSGATKGGRATFWWLAFGWPSFVALV